MPQIQRANRSAKSELHLDYRRGKALTDQIKTIYANLDAAVVETLRLNANMIETARDIGLAPEKGQKLFNGLNKCATTMIESREEFITAHRTATGIRMQTNQAETDWGCLPPPNSQVNEPHLQAVA